MTDKKKLQEAILQMLREANPDLFDEEGDADLVEKLLENRNIIDDLEGNIYRSLSNAMSEAKMAMDGKGVLYAKFEGEGVEVVLSCLKSLKKQIKTMIKTIEKGERFPAFYLGTLSEAAWQGYEEKRLKRILHEKYTEAAMEGKDGVELVVGTIGIGFDDLKDSVKEQAIAEGADIFEIEFPPKH